MKQLRLQIFLNGRELCIAGLEETGHISAEVSCDCTRRPQADIAPSFWGETPVGADQEDCDLFVNGYSFFPAPAFDFRWWSEPLAPGDEVTIRVLGPGPIDEPKVIGGDEPSESWDDT